jgi:hypothetical protein
VFTLASCVEVSTVHPDEWAVQVGAAVPLLLALPEVHLFAPDAGAYQQTVVVGTPNTTAHGNADTDAASRDLAVHTETVRDLARVFGVYLETLHRLVRCRSFVYWKPFRLEV